ncbi:TIGR04255 family protein [Thalassospira lucentensis]|uniref:TIGR04255 family protein n=1 Tax=Thalassospira lucentensis TaxID=168935 RepID=UPI00142DA0C8|nr:TIGR04255 family protein [Thalassospira lucentensis]NIZ00662.1 TIGR04255 family protein [Thalassospira lucentensis]
MPFPAQPRVIYDKNALVEVVCQVRFPTILKIEAEPPVAFQEAVRAKYPFFNEKDVIQLSLNADAPAQQVRQNGRVLEFTSSDQKSKIYFAKNFISYLSNSYVRWEDFRADAHSCISKFLSIYGVNNFTRIGLMYRNQITNQHAGTSNPNWGELLNPAISGIYSSSEIDTDAISSMKGTFSSALSDDGFVNAFYASEEESNIKKFAIDADFFSEEALTGGVEDVFERLDGFNRKSGSFFRWCISEKLHERLGPQPVS